MSFAAVLSRLAALDNPFPGLRPFDTAEAHLFFGRDQQVLDLADRLGRNHFVAVLGLSGSGKSSLVRAGLIPTLQRGRALELGKTWRVAIARPSGEPFANLAADLKCDASELRSSSHGLIDYVRRQFNPQKEALLLLVDQFEELFRYKDSAGRIANDLTASSEAAAFIALLLASAHSSLPIYIVITMRTDYLGDCAEFPDFPEALNESQYLVPRLTREQRRQAIEGPLGRVRISSALVERILNDAGDEPDQLPIMQHALMRTWSHWHDACPDNTRPVDNSDYEAIGGFSDALNQHADELLKTPAVLAAPGYVEILFKRLTAIGRGNRERRDPSPLFELWELCAAESDDDRSKVNSIIDVFRRGEATFLAPREGDLKPETFIDIAHESLIRHWKILAQEWLPDEEKQTKTLIELVDRAAGWRAHERDVLTGLDLAGAMQWNRRCNPSRKWAEHYVSADKLDDLQAFLAASRKHKYSTRARYLFSALLLLIAGAFFTFRALEEQKVEQSLDLASRAENLVSLDRSSDAIATAKQALRINDSAQARGALAHSFPQELVDFQGHSAPVFRAAFSPDEGQVLTASADRSAALWNASTGAPLFKLLGHTAEIHTARFSPDGQRIVTASADGSARLWDPASGKQLFNFAAHTSDVISADFSPNSQFVVTASNDWTARIWQVSSGHPVVTLSGHSGPVNSALFSPDNQRVVTASNDDTARLWNAANGKLLANLQGHRGDVQTAKFSPDGQHIVTASADRTARIWNAANGQPIATLTRHTAQVNSAEFSGDGKFIVTASDDHTAAVWNAANGQIVVQLFGHSGSVTGAVFSPDGKYVLTTSHDSTACLWDAANGNLLARLIGHFGTVYSAQFSSGGLHVLSAGEDSTARLWNVAAAAEVAEALASHDDGVNSAVFSPDDRCIVTASSDRTAQVHILESGRSFNLSGHAGSVNNAAFSPDGRRIATASADHTAWLWESHNGKFLLKLIGHTREVSSAAFSPDGSRILTASSDRTARIWNAATGQTIGVLTGHQGAVYNASFSSDGQRIATASEDKSVWIWDATTAKPTLKLLGHTGAVWTASFSRDGRQLITASDDGTARLWDLETGKQIRVLSGHAGAVYSAAFSPDGKSIVTASYDKSVRVWDAATGQVFAKLESHSDSVSTAAFSHDGKSVVTASLDHTSLIFTLVKLRDVETLLTSK